VVTYLVAFAIALVAACLATASTVFLLQDRLGNREPKPGERSRTTPSSGPVPPRKPVYQTPEKAAAAEEMRQRGAVLPPQWRKL
jgi:hypothetical protein